MPAETSLPSTEAEFVRVLLQKLEIVLEFQLLSNFWLDPRF